MHKMNEFNWPVRVYYEDTDAGGVVYHSNYVKFMERARTEWLRSVGYSQKELREKSDVAFVVRQINMKFQQPAQLDDLLNVKTRMKKTGGASFVFEQEVFKDQDLLCQAEVNIACLNINNGKPQGIPSELKAKLNDVN